MASHFRSRLRGDNALGRMLAISFAIHLGAILMIVVSPWDFFKSERPPMVSYTVDLVASDRLGGSAAPKSPPGARPGVPLPPVAREGATEKGKAAAAAKPPQPKPEAEKKSAEQAKAEAAKKQAEQVKAEAAKKQAEQAKADTAKKQAEAARKQAEQAKAEAAKKAAAAKALALKKKAEAEKKKAEADAAAKKKAEEAKKAEAAKKQAEEARKKEEAAKAEAKKAEAKKAAEKAAAAKVAAEKAAREKAEKDKAEKAAAEKAAAEKAAAEKAKADAARAEADAEAARAAIAAKLRDEHLAAAIEKLRGATAAENEVEGGTGLGGTGGGGVVQGLDFLLYKGVVENTIRQNWAWAGDSPGLKVVVGFGIQADGHIVDLGVVEPSGDATYDNLALRAVQSSDPLPPPPEEYRDEFTRYELELRAEDVGF